MKMPTVLFGNGLKRNRPATRLREAYCRIQTDLSLPYIDFPVPECYFPNARHIVYGWMHIDGFPVTTRYMREEECLRLWRGIRVYTNSRYRIIRLKSKDRLGLTQLKPRQSLTLGPFFSTPLRERENWTPYLRERLRQLKNPHHQMRLVRAEHPRDPFQYGTAYVIHREL